MRAASRLRRPRGGKRVAANAWRRLRGGNSRAGTSFGLTEGYCVVLQEDVIEIAPTLESLGRAKSASLERAKSAKVSKAQLQFKHTNANGSFAHFC